MPNIIDFSILPNVMPSAEDKVKNIREMVYTTLRIWIVHLYLVPDTVLVDKEICAALNVSQTPVREAFQRLAKDGVLTVYPQRGTYVSKISAERANEAKLIRRGLEREVLASLRLPLRQELLLKMQHNLSLQNMLFQDSEKPESAIEFFRRDNELHSIFFEHAGLLRVWEVIEQYSMNSDRVRILYLQNVSDWTPSLNQHKLMWEAAAEGSTEKLMTVWESHFENIDDAFLVARDRYPGYFL